MDQARHPQDPLSEFADQAYKMLHDHDTAIALMQRDLAEVKSRDAECRTAQGESWRAMNARMTTVEQATVSIAEVLKDKDSDKGRAVQVWVAVIAALAMLGATVITAISSAQTQAAVAALSK